MKNNKGRRYAVGVDFGGTYIKMGLVDEEGRLWVRRKLPTAGRSQPEDWIAAVRNAFDEMIKESGVRAVEIAGIGIGVPGLVDFERGFVYELVNVPGWKDVPLAEIMQSQVGKTVRVDNDVNAMAVGECMFGAGREYRNAVFATLGTGVGGALLIEGKLYRGAYSMAGEIGHISIDKDGRRSPQGRGGLEQYVGNRRIVERALRELRRGRRSKIRTLVGGRLDRITPREIAAAAQAGDRLALEIFDFMADCLATAFASLTYILQPEVFIVGGGVAHSGKVLFDPLNRHLRERLSQPFASRVQIVRARLGNDAGTVGAAALVLH